jgi:hypothetical protein
VVDPVGLVNPVAVMFVSHGVEVVATQTRPVWLASTARLPLWVVVKPAVVALKVAPEVSWKTGCVVTFSVTLKTCGATVKPELAAAATVT